MPSAPRLVSTNWYRAAEEVLGQRLRPKNSEEAEGATCPACGQGTDRMVVFRMGNYWCRHCGHRGWWLKVEPDERRRSQAEERVRKEEQQRDLLARMAKCTDWRAYASSLQQIERFAGAWLEQGISMDEIEHWGLGYCITCPAEPAYDSLTVPVFVDGTLVDIRHRLVGGVQGNKYRSHLTGLRPSPFNLDAAREAAEVLLVEGEKKAILAGREHRVPVGVPGAQFGRLAVEEIAKRMCPNGRLLVAFDPDANDWAEQTARTAAEAGLQGFVVDFPAKPDDYLLEYGARLFRSVLRQARPVAPKRDR